MPERAVIFGFEGPSLSADEISFFKEANPWGYIIFARNIETPDQVRTLTDSLRALTGNDKLPVLIDQEGGRVARFRGPHWRDTPAAMVFGDLYQQNEKAGLEAVWLNNRLLADELYTAGVSVDCLPMLDIRAEGSSDAVIGDRAYGDNAQAVTALGRAAAEGLLAGGVLPVIKHLPGHGRSLIDSHEGLPVVEASLDVLERSDFKPFASLSHLPLGMTGHLIFSAVDPDVPSTLSKKLIDEIIRSTAPGRIGFDGLLMTDDISMGALSNVFGGDYAERTRVSLAAGCDIILHCNGKMAEMLDIAGETPELCGKSAKRAEVAIQAFREPEDFDSDEGRNRLQQLIMANK